MPNFAIQEVSRGPERGRILGVDVEQPTDGYLTVPAGPGWGVQPDEAFLRAHPLADADRFPMAFAEDGSIVDL